MKKFGQIVLVFLLSVGMFTGCGTSYKADESTVFVLKDGKIVSTDVENFDEKTELEKEDGKKYVQVDVYSKRNGKRFLTKFESEGIKRIISLLSYLVSAYNQPSVCCCNFPLLSVNSFMLSKTTSEPCLFSEASSRTTVIPFIMVLLAVFTFSTVEMTRCKSALILSVKAPSDSFKWRIDST